MKRLSLLLSILVAASVSALAATPKLVVTILVDQMRYDYLERFNNQFTTNGFKLLTEQGVFMTSARYNYVPTVTGPGHASFLSGSTPMMHGIIANDWFDKRTRKEMYCVQDLSVEGVGTTTAKGKMSPRNFIGSTFADEMRLRYHSKVVGISMKDRGAILPAGKKPAGAYWFESKAGTFVTSSYYMKELPAWVKQFNDRKVPASFAGQKWTRLLDAKAYDYPDERAGEGAMAGETKPVFDHTIAVSAQGGYENIMPTPYGNELLLKFAEATIEGEGLGKGPQPDLLSVSFSSIDYCGHRFGPYSQEVQDITLRLDRQLAEFFTFLDKQIGMSNVLVVLTADHGVAPLPEFAAEQGLGGERLVESQFMLDLMGKLDERFGPGKYFLSPKIYEGMIYYNHETLAAKKLSAEELSAYIRELAFDSGKFQSVFTREQLLNGNAPGLIGKMVLNGYNAERGGDIVLIAKPYVVPSAAKTGTTHGSPYFYDARIPVLFYGGAFKPGRYADEFYITDIVPTLCTALRVTEPTGCMGKPFLKALAQP